MFLSEALIFEANLLFTVAGCQHLFSVVPCRILASCTELMQAIKVLVLSSKDLQRDIVESGRVSFKMFDFCL